MFHRIWATSIWHPDAIAPAERHLGTPLLRVVLPVFDVLMIVLGVLGLGEGFRALRLTFPYPVPDLIYGAIAGVGVVCFVGVAFPVLQLVEAIAKCVLMGLLTVLLVAMLIAGATVAGHAGLAVAPLIAGCMLIPGLRLWLIGRDRARRRAWSG